MSVEPPVEPVLLPAPELEVVPLFVPEDGEGDPLSDGSEPELLPEPAALPAELPDPETAPEDEFASFVREVEDDERSPVLDDIEPEPLADPEALPEPEIAPEDDLVSFVREDEPDERSPDALPEPDTAPELEVDESREPVDAPPRIVVSLRTRLSSRMIVSLRTPRSSRMTVSLPAVRPSCSWTAQPARASMPASDMKPIYLVRFISSPPPKDC